MYLPKSTDSGDFVPAPSGTHLAICYRLIDLGTQKTEWSGEINYKRKIMLSWELPHEPMQDDRPISAHQRYTYSSHEKSRLRKDLEAWRGKAFRDEDFGPGGFDIKNILGKGCYLSIVQTEKDGRTYANINSVSALPKGTETPKPANPIVYFSLDEFDQAVFDALPDSIKDIIKRSPEYQAAVMGQKPVRQETEIDDLSDSIPF